MLDFKKMVKDATSNVEIQNILDIMKSDSIDSFNIYEAAIASRNVINVKYVYDNITTDLSESIQFYALAVGNVPILDYLLSVKCPMKVYSVHNCIPNVCISYWMGQHGQLVV